MPGTTNVEIVQCCDENSTILCGKCRRVLGALGGKFVICFSITNGGNVLSAFVAHEKLTHCCGEGRLVIRAFDTESEARTEGKLIIDRITADGNYTKKLKLVGIMAIGQDGSQN